MKKVVTNIDQFNKAMKNNDDIYLIDRLYDWYYKTDKIPNVINGEKIYKFKNKCERIEEYENKFESISDN